jgi:hypothetical protein
MEKEHMRNAKLNLPNVQLSGFFTVAIAAFLLLSCVSPSAMAQQPGQKIFSSADEASHALVRALGNDDNKTLLQILGPDGKEVVSSGDPVEDEATRANFVSKFHEMHRLVVEPDGTTTLYIGAENWPTPIPLVNKGGNWYFDTAAGKQEILYRRVGKNEMSAIKVCQELVAAQKEYFAKEHNEYAQRFVSDEGKHDGLYWLGTNNEFESPIGPQVANAGSPGDLANGKMTRGFAFVAYPAEYRNSGVVTFVVSQDGVVYEKDLGQRTETLAKDMKGFDPDSSWQKAEQPPAQSASEQQPQ